MRFGPEGTVTRRRVILKWALLAVALGFALAIDLITKGLAREHLAPGEVVEVLPFLSLERTANTGVAFGLLRGGGWLIVVANVIAMAIVLFYVALERRPLLGGIAGGLVIGGSLGNVVQRLSGDGRVTDFLKFPHWPNFNMADVFLLVGIAAIFLGLVVETVRVWKAGRRDPSPG